MKLLCLLMLAGVTCGSIIRKLQQIPEPVENGGPTVPCQAERESAGPNDLLPECDEFGHYLPKQCNGDSTMCWCVSQCGDVLIETKGGPDLVCEQVDPPCHSALGESKARGVLFGKFKPKCHENGFYDHTQCLGSVCWCTDRCGNRVEDSKHYLWNRGFCACPNNDQAWKCTGNPCDDLEAPACPDHPDAVCRPFICGGCSYKFYVNQQEVDCGTPEPEVEPEPEPIAVNREEGLPCVDNLGTTRMDRATWKVDKCEFCRCLKSEVFCVSPNCTAPLEGRDCTIKPGTQDDCCPSYDCHDEESIEPPLVRACTDLNGTVRETGESWKESRCMTCFCSSGGRACVSPMCAGPPAGQQCRIRPGTEDDCCHQYDCEALNLEEGLPCIDNLGTTRMDRATWKVDKCEFCRCLKGEVFCVSPNCTAPLEGRDCTIKPGTQDDCCPSYDCHDVELVMVTTCTDWNGIVRETGESWKEGRCMDCFCYSGGKACSSPMCMGPPARQQCRIRPGTEDDCCHQYDCEGSLGVAEEASCTDKDGHVREHGERWKEGRCKDCLCDDGSSACSTPKCRGPPAGKECKVMPGTEENCCPEYNCVDELVMVTTCTDWNGIVRENGEEWKEGKCVDCFCSSGRRVCVSTMCAGPPAGQQCRIRPGTEDDCCHQYDCEVSSPCVLPDGTIHTHGDRWSVGKCMSCLCNNGLSECNSPMCLGPPMSDQYCSVRPGTEENCCPEYDCEGCVDTMGNHYAVNETWGNPCNQCKCKGDEDAYCKTEVCIGLNRAVSPPCHWVIQPDECCPRDTGPGGTVCDEPISACDPGSSIAPECPTHLCLEATCSNHPDAQCMISRCGHCHTVFYLEGYKVECGNEPITIRPVCPKPVSMQCIMSPCPSEECTYHPEAVCYTDYCEPCQAVFYDENDRPLICGDPSNIVVQCKDSINTKHAVGDMWEEGCNECTCQASGIPTCTANKCAIDRNHLPLLCEAVYGDVDKCCPARMVCYEAISECPQYITVAPSCPDDLCVSATCETHPQAKCRISRCGGCSVKFFDENKQLIEECSGQPLDLCPNDGPVVACFAPACLDATCDSKPGLTCHADACEPCTPVFHDDNNNLHSCTPVLEVCLDSSNTNTYAVGESWEEDCKVCTCSDNGMSICIAKTCVIDGSHLPPLCEVVYREGDNCCPARMVCYEAISECPQSIMVAPSCPDDLCVSATCETHPQAKCRISRCGGCSVKFFDENKRPIEECTGKRVDLHTVCPIGGPVVACFAPACRDATCDSNPGLTCHADACEPCTPVFHDDNNNLQSCTLGTANLCNPAVKIVTPRGTRTLPRCLWNGKFSPKQCDSMGYCWCVGADGSMVDTPDQTQTGQDLICGFSLPCQYEVKINKVKKERGKPVTFNPTCLTNGFYDTVQCNAEECWCSEKDGTVVIGSKKPQGESLKCSSVCLGDPARTIPHTFCTRTDDKCPSNSFCHIPTNRSSGRCCLL
ncbi:kielin/chordin-like protein [Asterias amurensis]|uniref:kielin/chordin-like protein n=1 Tax=Asterias amurensis TaxID=7602 RepID=UPI003AB8AD45